MKKLLWIIFGRHKWTYRNPYDRTCSVCGKHEIVYCSNVKGQSNSWWEVFNDGDESKHYSG